MYSIRTRAKLLFESFCGVQYTKEGQLRTTSSQASYATMRGRVFSFGLPADGRSNENVF
jgi:hypothetical protein